MNFQRNLLTRYGGRNTETGKIQILIVFSNNITPRLQYIFHFISKEITNVSVRFTNLAEEFRQYSGAKINYSNERIIEEEFFIKPHSLLFEQGIRPQSTPVFISNEHQSFFKTTGDFPFDIFAASFYLLSRYEEYLPHKKDAYGRYDHQDSIACKENFLHLPLINLWIADLKKVLQKRFPDFPLATRHFKFIPTYDIDEAWAFRNKSLLRTTGGLVKSMIRGRWSMVRERMKVMMGKKQDPYYAYLWMNDLHERYKLKPYYFFHVAQQVGRYDKNIPPSNVGMQKLIVEHSKRYDIGIHPSWQSGDSNDKLKYEILKLGHVSGRSITVSRQHFIRFTLPSTYRKLLEYGIETDFSMGYGSINGFRASVASPFYWYDLEKEEQTELLLYPFSFMEANSFFEQKCTAQQALEEMQRHHYIIRSVNGTMVTIWHNTFLGTAKMFEGWKEVYEQFIKEVTK